MACSDGIGAAPTAKIYISKAEPLASFCKGRDLDQFNGCLTCLEADQGRQQGGQAGGEPR